MYLHALRYQLPFMQIRVNCLSPFLLAPASLILFKLNIQIHRSIALKKLFKKFFEFKSIEATVWPQIVVKEWWRKMALTPGSTSLQTWLQFNLKRKLCWFSGKWIDSLAECGPPAGGGLQSTAELNSNDDGWEASVSPHFHIFRREEKTKTRWIFNYDPSTEVHWTSENEMLWTGEIVGNWKHFFFCRRQCVCSNCCRMI